MRQIEEAKKVEEERLRMAIEAEEKRRKEEEERKEAERKAVRETPYGVTTKLTLYCYGHSLFRTRKIVLTLYILRPSSKR